MSSGRKGSLISIVQCTPTCLALLRVRPGKGGVDIAEFHTQTGTWSEDDGSLLRAFVSFAQQHDLKKDRIFAIMPRHKATVRVQDFPSQDVDEISSMVQLTAEELVPFSADEVVASECILDTLDNGHSQVLVTVVHQDMVNAQIALFQGAEIEVEQIYLSTTCLMAALTHPVGHEHDNTFLLYSDGHSLESIQLVDGSLEFNRAVVLESNQDLSGNVSTILNSVLRETTPHSESLDMASSAHPNGTLDAVTVTKPGFSVNSLSAGLKSVKKGVEHLGDHLPVAMFGAVLIAQKDSNLGIELLPKQVLSSRAGSRLKEQLLRLAVASSILVACIVGIYFQAVGQREAYVQSLERQAEELRPETSSLLLKRKNLRRLQEQVERNITMYELLGMVTEEVPAAGINVNRYLYRQDEEMILQGRATSPDKFDTWIDNLRNPEGKSVALFAQAREMYRNAITERRENIWEYSISIPLTPLNEGDSDE